MPARAGPFTRLNTTADRGILMKRLLPRGFELALLAVLACTCAIIVELSPQRDVGLMMAGMPLFLISALLGFRRSEARRVAEAVSDQSEPQ